MRPRSTAIIVGLAIASLIGAIAVSTGQAGRTALARGERLVPGLAERLEQVAAIEIATGGATIRLARQGTNWVLPDLAGYPARIEAVRQALVAVAAFETIEPRTRSADLYSRLGLEDPAEGRQGTRLTLRDAGNAVLADLVLGKRRSPPVSAGAAPDGQQMLYLRRAGDPQTFLALGTIDIRPTALEWAERQIANFSLNDLVRVELTPGGDHPAYVMVKPTGTGDLVPEAIPDGKEVKSRFEANAQGRTLEVLQFEAVIRRPATLPAPRAQGVYRFESGLAVTLALVDHEGALWATLAAEGEGAEPHNTTWRPWLYRLPDWKRDQVTTPLDQILRDKPAG
jgi:hypothetical protein